MPIHKPVLVIITILQISLQTAAQPQLHFEEIISGLQRPVDIANADDGSGRLFIVDANGYISILDSTGTLMGTPFIDIGSIVHTEGERGLLGLAFHPDYEENGYFYVNYTDLNSDTRIVRYQVSEEDPNVADPTTAAIMFEIDQPYNNHNGGCLKFGPDGYLYIALGDGGDSGDPQCRAQDSLDLLGKILRVDVNQNVSTSPYYGIPPDNPFVGNPNGADQVWCVGLRNPWKFSFDRETGDMWIADVGQGQHEEVNVQPASSSGGENYGWKVMEGANCYDSDPIDTDCPPGTPSCGSPVYTSPLFYYTHSEPQGGRSITGGFVYRGCRYPGLDGHYIMADYITAHAWLLTGDGTDIFYDNQPDQISSFGESESGEIYAVSLDGGKLYEVRDASIPYDLEVFAADGPLKGVLRAANSITIIGNVTVTPNDSVFLIAPTVVISDSLTVNNPSVITIETNCN